MVVTNTRNRFETVRDLIAELNKQGIHQWVSQQWDGTWQKTTSGVMLLRRNRCYFLLTRRKGFNGPRHINRGLGKSLIHWLIQVRNFESKHCQFVRRLPHEFLNPQCVFPTVKHGGGFVMVWVSFGGNKVGDMVKGDGKMNQKVYNGLLQWHAKTSGLGLIGKGFVLQLDNGLKHTSRLCKNYVKSLEDNKMFKTWNDLPSPLL